MPFHNIIWDDDEYYSEEIEEFPCERCKRVFFEFELSPYEDYEKCCLECANHLEDPKGYPHDPKEDFKDLDKSC